MGGCGVKFDVLADTFGTGQSFRCLAVGDEQGRFDMLTGHGATTRSVKAVSYTDMGPALKKSDFDAVLVNAHGDNNAVVSAIKHGVRSPAKTIVVGYGDHEWNRLRSTILEADGYYAMPRRAGSADMWMLQGGKADLTEGLRRALPDLEDDDLDRLMAALNRTVLDGRSRGRSLDSIVQKAVKSYVTSVPARGHHQRRMTTAATDAVRKVVADQAPKPDSIETTAEAEELYWNTRFPEHPEVLGRTPHRVQRRRLYPLETALEVAAGDEDSAAIAAAEVVGQDVRFELRAFGAVFVPQGERKGRRALTSDPITCTETGTEPFTCRVRFVADVGQSARVHLSLLVNGGAIAERDIRVGVVDAAPPPPRKQAPAESARVVSGAISGADPTALRLVLDRGQGALLYADDGEPYADADAPDADAEAWEVAAKIATLLKLSEVGPIGKSASSFGLADSDDAVYQLACIGAELHDALFLRGPPGRMPDKQLMQLANTIRDRGSSTNPVILQIDAPGYPVPWGLLYDRSKRRGFDLVKGNVDIDGFWGRRFDVQRGYLVSDLTCDRGGHPMVQPVVGPLVPSGGPHLAFITKLSQKNVATIAPAVENADGLLQWVASDGPTDLLYLFCHARPAAWIDAAGGLAAPKSMYESRFGFGEKAPGSNDGVTLRDLMKAWRGDVRPTNPVVIANGCSTGSLDPRTGTPFVDFFMKDWKAQAFIGTDWPVNGVFADRIGRLVLSRLLAHGDTLRGALRYASKRAFEDGNPFPVMYGIYGPPKVRFA